MTGVIGVAVAILAAAVLVGFLFRLASRSDQQAATVRRCDLCERAPATVHLVDTFDDEDEHEFGLGASAMRADYCQPCADVLGVGG